MLQSVPVLNQSVSSRLRATDARRSPLAVTSGLRNLPGSSGLAVSGAGTFWFMAESIAEGASQMVVHNAIKSACLGPYAGVAQW